MRQKCLCFESMLLIIYHACHAACVCLFPTSAHAGPPIENMFSNSPIGPFLRVLRSIAPCPLKLPSRPLSLSLCLCLCLCLCLSRSLSLLLLRRRKLTFFREPFLQETPFFPVGRASQTPPQNPAPAERDGFGVEKRKKWGPENVEEY